MRTRVAAVPLTVVLACLAATAAGAQTQWLDRGTRNAARLDVAFPGLGDEDAGTFPMGAAFATARVAVARGTWLVGELPYAHVRVSQYVSPVLYGGQSPDGTNFGTGSTLGNPYLGVEHALSPEAMRVEFGLRPSVANANQVSALFAGFGSGVEHQEAFVPRTVHVRGAIAWQAGADRDDRFGIAARIAPTWEIVTHNPLFEVQSPVYPYDLEPVHLSPGSRMVLDYAVNARLQGPNGRIAVGLAGRRAPAQANEFSAIDFRPEANSAADFTMMLELIHARVQPSFALRLPIGDETKQFEASHGAFTFGLLVPFGGTARRGE
jgi:hypothetical protein